MRNNSSQAQGVNNLEKGCRKFLGLAPYGGLDSYEGDGYLYAAMVVKFGQIQVDAMIENLRNESRN